jgi:DNA-binding XRE family transcriptional regulator
MSTAAQPRHYSRQFLNEPGHHGLAAVLTEVNDGDTDSTFLDFGASVTISDCNRTVTLDFGVYGGTGTDKDRAELRASLKNARAKAALLQAELNAFVGALDEALVDVETELDKRERKAKKAKKKAKKAAKKG